MVLKSYAKINLSLRVNSRTVNGLHEIQSLYCLINLSDNIKICKIKDNKDKISFKGPFKNFIKKKNNTVINLLKLLRQHKLISNYYYVSVKKNIPVFGGLGGGTSNAAFILNYLVKNKVSKKLFKKMEGIIGSDLKLFFKGQGFLRDLNSIFDIRRKQKLYFALIQPKIKCSTKEIYSKVKKYSKKEKFNIKKIDSKRKLINYLRENKNDLQFIVEKKYPIIKKILKDIGKVEGCYYSRITGSGSVCYGLFKDQISAKKAIYKLKFKYPKFWISFAKTV